MYYNYNDINLDSSQIFLKYLHNFFTSVKGILLLTIGYR